MNIEVTYKNYENFIDQYFTKIPTEITIKKSNGKLVENDFKEVFDSIESRNSKYIVYVWRTKNKISRLKGSSNIVYIGQTSKSLQVRHSKTSDLKATSEANSQKYNDIINIHGPITIQFLEMKKLSITGIESLLELESQFLWWYFRNHSEYPPVNYTKTGCRNNNPVIFNPI